MGTPCTLDHLALAAQDARKTVLRLPAPVQRNRLVELVQNSQLAVSHEGDHAAVVVNAFHGRGFQVVHSGLTVPSEVVLSDARILKVTPHRAVAWGALERGWTGTFILSESGTTVRQPLSSLRTLHPASRFGLMPRGTCEGDPEDTERLVLLDTSFLIQKDSDWVVMHDGSILLVEALDGPRFRYRVVRTEKDGVEMINIVDFSPPLPFEAVTARALKLGVRYMYVVDRKGGKTVLWIDGMEFPIDGVVEHTWNSPNARSVVLLIRNKRIAQPHGAQRRIVRIAWPPGNKKNGELMEVLYAGRFEMNPRDLWWSADGYNFAAQFTAFRQIREQEIEIPAVMTAQQSFLVLPDNAQISSAAMDATGDLVGYVLDYGDRHVPVIGGKELDPVPLAWNMHECSGHVRYNSIEGEDVFLNCLDLNRL